MKVEVLKPAENAPEVLAGEIALYGRDLRKIWVIAPNRRFFLYLNHYLGQRLGPFISPEEFTEDEFMELIGKKTGEIRGKRAEKLDALFYLKNAIEKASSGGLLKTSPDFSHFTRWGLAFLEIFDELEEHLLLEDSDDAEKKWRLAKEPLEKEADEFSRFIRELVPHTRELALILRSLLNENGFYTRGMAYRSAGVGAEKFKPENIEALYWYLPYALSPAEKKVIKTLSSTLPVVLIYHHPGSLGLLKDTPEVQKFMCELTGDELNEPEWSLPSLEFYRAFSEYSQVKLLRELLSKSDFQKPESIAIIPLSGDVLPALISECLEKLNEKYNITMGLTLQHFPPHSLLLSVIKIWETKDGENVHTPSLFSLLKHPYVRNIPDENGSTISPAVNILEREIIQRHLLFISRNKFEEMLDKASNSHTTGEVFSNIVQLIFDEREQDTPGNTAGRLEDFLTFILSKRFERESEHPFQADFIEKTLEVLRRFQLSHIRDMKLSLSDRLFLIKHSLNSERVPLSGVPLSGVQVMGLLETRGIKFERVFLLDATEEHLPSKFYSPWFPRRVREVLNLPLSEDAELLQRFYFSRLACGASEITAIYVKNDENLKSPFLEELQFALKLEGKEVPVFDVHPENPPSAQGAKNKGVYFEKTPAVMEILKNTSFSPTAINTYMRCPARFYFQYVLGLREPDVLQEDVEGAVVGTIIHQVLEELFAPFVNRGAISSRDIQNLSRENNLARLVKKAMEKNNFSLAEKEASGLRELIFNTLMLHLKGYLKIFEEQLMSGQTEILALETTMEAPFEVKEGVSIKLKGRADRIDRKNGEIHILDYKTGSSEESPLKRLTSIEEDPAYDPENIRKQALRTLKSCQLPVYLYLAKEGKGLFQSYKNANAGLIMLREVYSGDKNKHIKLLFSDKSPKDTQSSDEREHLMEVYMKYVRLVVREIIDSNVPFAPDYEDERYCNYCTFAVHCRRFM